MVDPERRVYTPSLDIEDNPLTAEQSDQRRKMMIAALMAIAVGAVGAFAWNTYGNFGAPPLITVASRDFKTIAPAPPSAQSGEPKFLSAIEGEKAPPLTTRAPSAEEPLPGMAAPQAPVARTAPEAPSAPTADGGFLVQLAALRTRDDAEMQWRTFQSKAPGLASSARMDIQRADLGAQGIYFRLRAGFFDTRERASAYCDKAKAQGQDCMVVVR